MKRLSAFVIFALLNSALPTSIASAKPLPQINVFEYLTRLAALKHTDLDPGTVKTLSTKIVDGCQVDHVQFAVVDPSTNASREVAVDMYHPPQEIQYPTLIIAPTVLGQTLIEETASFHFCKSNFMAVLADFNVTSIPTAAQMPDWGLHDRVNRQTIIAMRTLIDLLQAHKLVNPKKIGALGLSLGAFTMAMLSTVDDRLKAVALVAGAGNMPSILAYSQDKTAARFRNARMIAINDQSPVDYENNLRANLFYDPIYMARNIDTAKYFMILNETDTSVPTENQLELWNAFGQPERFNVSATHPETIIGAVTVHYPLLVKEIVSRFDQ